MLSLTLEGQSWADLCEQLKIVYAQFFGESPSKVPLVEVAEPILPLDKRKPGRPKTEKAAVPHVLSTLPVSETDMFADAVPLPVTLDQVKDALQALAKPREGEATAVQGMARARAILKTVAGVERIKEVPIEKYRAVLEACGKEA